MADTTPTAPAHTTTPAGRRTIRLVDEDLDALRRDVAELTELVGDGAHHERLEALRSRVVELTAAVDRLVDLLDTPAATAGDEAPTGHEKAHKHGKHRGKHGKHKGSKNKTKKKPAKRKG
jgi:hypothetical protein